MDTPIEATREESVVTAPSDRAHEELAHHPGPKEYIVVAVALAVATLLEVGLYYLRDVPESLVTILLLFFMALKFALVVLYFMHLKFDNSIFRRLFVTGLILALTVYLVVLLTFGLLID